MIGIPQASPPTKVHGLVIIRRLKVLPIILKQLHSLEPRETANSLDIRSLLCCWNSKNMNKDTDCVPICGLQGGK